MTKLVWLTLLALHTGVTAVWWWMQPHGFPSSSTEYWLNEVVPILVGLLLATTLFARGRLSEALLPPVLAALPLYWMAFGIAARVTFVDSFESLWKLPFLGGALLSGLWVQQFRLRLRPIWLLPLFALPAIGAGWAMPGWLRSPDAATTPTGSALGDVPAATSDHRVIKLTKDAQVRPDDGRLVVRRDKLILNVQPLMSFANRSPDRCFVSLAPDGASKATQRALTAKIHDGAHWRLYYKDEDVSVLDVTATRDGAVQLDARARLPQPIYAHNDSYAELTITGHHKLSVAFSPLPAQRIEAPPASGAARFAYVDAAHVLHIAQAAARQLGPFTELAAAPLPSTTPLTLTIYDDDRAVFTVALEDWAAQASTALSPTAGWNVPVNAITLVRGSDLDTAPVLITLTLADTSLGRGTQSVGHAAGVYRNRLTVALP